MERKSLGYNAALNGLRGVAVLAVMAFHFDIPSVAQAGYCGVDIFFVLSGFLITTLLVQEWDSLGSIDLRDFYFRRVRRLIPALLMVLVFCIILVPVSQIVVSLAQVSNWAVALDLLPMNRYPLGHVWSLAVEWQYYLIWPPVVLLLLHQRVPRRFIFAVPVGFALVSAIMRVIYFQLGFPWLRIYYGTDTHIDGLLIGSALGLIVAWGLLPTAMRWRRCQPVALVFSASVLGWLAYLGSPNPFWLSHGLYLLLALATTLIIVTVLVLPAYPVTRLLSVAPLVYIGRISYGLYLWHLPIHFVLGTIGIAAGFQPGVLVHFMLPILVASASYHFVENPLLKLKAHRRSLSHARSREVVPSDLAAIECGTASETA